MTGEDEVVNIPTPTERDPRVYDVWKSGFKTNKIPADRDLQERQRQKFFELERGQ